MADETAVGARNGAGRVERWDIWAGEIAIILEEAKLPSLVRTTPIFAAVNTLLCLSPSPRRTCCSAPS